MIVDVHTHTPTHREPVPDDERLTFRSWRAKPVSTTTSWTDFDDARRPADVSIVFNIAVADPLAATGIPTDPARINDSTAEFAAADPAHRIGFMSVDPHDPGAIDEVERCLELGLAGIKLGPNYQGFDPLCDDAHRLYQVAEERQLPIIFHQGTSPIREALIRYAYPLAMDEVAVRHPDLRIVMAHMGHPWVRETVAVIRKHPNVYADVSALFHRPWMCWEALIMATEWGAANKLLLGSDFPIATVSETIEGLNAVNRIVEGTNLPQVPAAILDGIVHADALTFLGLERQFDA
jgi:uncharacterized protein